ncbi:HNH endonuclease [Psychromonas sp. MB-3u-54]|nr:HNH endonuclease [Psychromonas sp. MB-3u-54]
MINAVNYSEDELIQITSKKEEVEFSAKSWSDSCLNNLKVIIKNHYVAEQNTTCPYCKRDLQTTHGRAWDIEHIIPRSIAKNFMFEPLNLCMACIDCNGAKSNKKVTNSTARHRYPAHSNSFLFVHPHFDNYNDNILVIRPGFLYVAKTDKGNQTINICGLNRFYSSAGFGADADTDERIFLLAQSLLNTDNPRIKKSIRSQLIELSIKASM